MRNLLLLAALVCGAASAQTDYSEVVTRAKSAVTRDLKDPSSAQYRNLYISESTGAHHTLCGEINAKNGYGAYVGFKPFYAEVEGDWSQYEIANPMTQVQSLTWARVCGRKLHDVR